MKRIIYAFILCVPISCFASVSTANILNSSVLYDEVTGLYTYSYILDFSNSPRTGDDPTEEGITRIYIGVGLGEGALRPPDVVWVPAYPIAVTSPNGWSFNAGSAFTSSPLYGDFYWGWGAYNGLLPGDTLDGFSFTTDQAPSGWRKPNYYLLVGGGGDDYPEIGSTLAPYIETEFFPPLPSTNVPIPAAFWLFGTGLLGLWGLRRKLRN